MPLKGFKHTKETKQKIREIKREAFKKNGIRPPSRKGIKLTEEHKRKLSEASMGNKYSLGKKHSLETRHKMSETRKGEKHPMFGKHRSLETRQKISDSRKGKCVGENHPHWNGGSSFEPYSIDWTETLRRAIRERDNYLCQLCSQYGDNVHHLDYNKENCNPDNLITLCRKCNTKVNYNREFWTNYFRTNRRLL